MSHRSTPSTVHSIPHDELITCLSDTLTPDDRMYIVENAPIGHLVEIFEYLWVNSPRAELADIIGVLIGRTSVLDYDNTYVDIYRVIPPAEGMATLFLEHASTVNIVQLAEIFVTQKFKPSVLNALFDDMLSNAPRNVIFILYILLPIKTVELTIKALDGCLQHDFVTVIQSMPEDFRVDQTIIIRALQACSFADLTAVLEYIDQPPLDDSAVNRLIGQTGPTIHDAMRAHTPLTRTERLYCLENVQLKQLTTVFVYCQRFALNVPEELDLVLARLTAIPMTAVCKELLLHFYHYSTLSVDQTLKVIDTTPPQLFFKMAILILNKMWRDPQIGVLFHHIVTHAPVEILLEIFLAAKQTIMPLAITCQIAINTCRLNELFTLFKLFPAPIAYQASVKLAAIVRCPPANIAELREYITGLAEKIVATPPPLSFNEFVTKYVDNEQLTADDRRRVICTVDANEVVALLPFLTEVTMEEYFILLKKVPSDQVYKLMATVSDPSADLRQLALVRAEGDAGDVLTLFKDPTDAEINIVVTYAQRHGAVANTAVAKTRFKARLLEKSWDWATHRFLDVTHLAPDAIALPDWSTPVTTSGSCYDYFLVDDRVIASLTPKDNVYIFFVDNASYCCTRDELYKIFINTDEWFYECIGDKMPPVVNPTALEDFHHPAYTTYPPYISLFGFTVPVLSLYAILQQDLNNISPANKRALKQQQTTTDAALYTTFTSEFKNMLSHPQLVNFTTNIGNTIHTAWYNDKFFTIRAQIVKILTDSVLIPKRDELTTRIVAHLVTLLGDTTYFTPSLMTLLCEVLAITNPVASIDEIATQLANYHLLASVLLRIKATPALLAPGMIDTVTQLQTLIEARAKFQYNATQGYIPRNFHTPLDTLTDLYQQHRWISNLNTFVNQNKRFFYITATGRRLDKIVDQNIYTSRRNMVSRNHCNGDPRVISKVYRVAPNMLRPGPATP